MSNGAGGSSGKKKTLRGIKIPQMYSCLAIDDVEFSFNKSFIRPNRAFTLEKDISNMRKANPSNAKLHIFGHTDNVASDSYNKFLSDRRARSIYSFLTLDFNDWINLLMHEGWNKLEVQETISALQQNGANNQVPKATLPIDAYLGSSLKKPNKKLLLRLYEDYMKHFISQPLNPTSEFCGIESYSGCSEFNPVTKASVSKNKIIRNKENEKNRRAIIFLFEPISSFPCKLDDLKPCYKFRYKKTSSHNTLFTCEFYDQFIANGKCPIERKQTPSSPPIEPSQPTKEIEVSLGFPATKVNLSPEKRQKHKLDTETVLYAKILEEPEVVDGGRVKCVLKAEVDSVIEEQELQGNINFIPPKPLCLLKTTLSYRNNEYYLKAEVVIRETGEKLFEAEIHAPRLIGVEGYWEVEKSDRPRKVWRHIRSGRTPKPGYEIKYMKGLGLDNYRKDLTLMLRIDRNGRWTEFRNITDRVKDIMRKRGFKAK